MKGCICLFTFFFPADAYRSYRLAILVGHLQRAAGRMQVVKSDNFGHLVQSNFHLANNYVLREAFAVYKIPCIGFRHFNVNRLVELPRT